MPGYCSFLPWLDEFRHFRLSSSWRKIGTYDLCMNYLQLILFAIWDWMSTANHTTLSLNVACLFEYKINLVRHFVWSWVGINEVFLPFRSTHIFKSIVATTTNTCCWLCCTGTVFRKWNVYWPVIGWQVVLGKRIVQWYLKNNLGKQWEH